MSISPIFERIKALCKDNGISVSTLMTEVTGNVGNAPTWKKGHIRTDYLTVICAKFKVSADYLLCITDNPNPSENTVPYVSPEEFAIIGKLRALPPDKRKAIEMLLD